MGWRRLLSRTITLPLVYFFFFLSDDVVLSSFAAAISGASSDLGIQANEKAALVEFKGAVVSDPAGLLSTWNDESSHCNWYGVTCDYGSRVYALNITGSFKYSCYSSRYDPFRDGTRCSDPKVRLGGKLSPAVGRLERLKVLSLKWNQFVGHVPDGITGLRSLEVIELEGNAFEGMLPTRFGKGLRVVSLGFNEFQGKIPLTLENCADLEVLDLSHNEISGTVPGFLGKLSKLKSLALSFNWLSGLIPDGIGDGCLSLEHLDLSGNLFSGSLPASLGNCGQLQNLLVFSNSLENGIPPELGRLDKLQVLDVSRNSLSGRLPAELGKCLELTVLVLSNAYDTIPWDSGTQNDEFNYFEGGIHENITSTPNLRILWAPRATLEGKVPSNWGSCKNLEMVNMGENLFTGGLPLDLGKCRNLKHLNLSSNKLTGWLSPEFSVPCMDVFDVSMNHLSGSIPNFWYFECSSSHVHLNDVVSAYYSFFKHTARWRVQPFLSEPSKSAIILHDFGKNKFSGSFPSLPVASEKLSRLSIYALHIDHNRISGLFPGTLLDKCNITNRFILNVSSNIISGRIPDDIDVLCSSLMVLDASNNQITGVIPQQFGLLSLLFDVDLSRNKLQGKIPATISLLKGLKQLSLARNNLTGEIPVSLSQLHSLKVLDLSSNSFSGEIPKEVLELTNLSVLLLNNNNLSGKIPACLSNSTSLSLFNVSYNNLSGSVPLSAVVVTCDSILGNLMLNACRPLSRTLANVQDRGEGMISYTTSPPSSSPPALTASGFTSIEIASIASATAIVSVLLALIFIYIYTRKCAPRSTVRASGRRDVTVFIDLGVPLNYENVVRATGGFNASNCIGSGGFGATYKAEVAPGVIVAVKRLSVGRIQGVQQFHAEVKTLGRWRHPNLVTLIGFHVSETEMFLIYNYLPGGNLERFIQERHKRPIDWRMLHKIALDVARALAYLHDHCVPRILHRDVKPSNILLDNNYTAYLSDFGLARLLGNSETHATTGVAGTFGYVAPEYAMTCRVSDKADVYSYGIVLLELISNKKALDPSFSPYGNGFNIVHWAHMLLRKGRAQEFFTDGLWDAGPHDDLVETLHLGITCTDDSLSTRPTMKYVVQKLKQIQPPMCSPIIR